MPCPLGVDTHTHTYPHESQFKNQAQASHINFKNTGQRVLGLKIVGDSSIHSVQSYIDLLNNMADIKSKQVLMFYHLKTRRCVNTEHM